MKLNIKVNPGAASESMEWLGQDYKVLKIRLPVAAEKGKANKAVTAYLARQLGLPPKFVSITSGTTSQKKTVVISGLSKKEIMAKLPDICDDR